MKILPLVMFKNLPPNSRDVSFKITTKGNYDDASMLWVGRVEASIFFANPTLIIYNLFRNADVEL